MSQPTSRLLVVLSPNISMSDLCVSPSWTSRYLTILSRKLAKMSSFQGAANTDFEHHEHHEHHSLYRSARQVDHLCTLRQAVQRQTFTKGQTVAVVLWIFWTCYNLFKLKPGSMSKSHAQLEGASTSRDQCGLLGSLGRGKARKLGALDMDRRKDSHTWRRKHVDCTAVWLGHHSGQDGAHGLNQTDIHPLSRHVGDSSLGC